MLPPPHRLRRAADIGRVRRGGRTVRHPLATLVYCPTGRSESRFAFLASRRVGNSVKRNRARRLLREAVRLRLADLGRGWDCLLIARPATAAASFAQVDAAVHGLLCEAGLAAKADGDTGSR